MTPSTRAMVELWSFAHCFDPASPLEGLIEEGGETLELTPTGAMVAERLARLTDEALEGPAGMSEHRPLLMMARVAFRSGDGEAVCAAAAELARVRFTVMLPPAVAA